MGNFETKPLCDIPLPTVSVMDTAQTIMEVDNFSEKFRSGCNLN